MKFVLAIIFAAAVIGRLSTLIVPVGASVQAAQPAEPSECTAAATADGETLYSCNVDGVMCVWDPSPALGAGVLTCGW